MKKIFVLILFTILSFLNVHSFASVAILPPALQAIGMTHTALDTSDKLYKLNKNTGQSDEEFFRKYRYALLIGTALVFTGFSGAFIWDQRNAYLDRKQEKIDKEKAMAAKAKDDKDVSDYRTLKLYQLQKNANPRFSDPEAESALNKRFSEMNLRVQAL